MQKPSVGRIVHYIEGDHEGHTHHGLPESAVGPHYAGVNGTRMHPAIITRVWSDSCVNLIVFFDARGQAVRTSETRIDTPADTHNPNSGWRWPERV